MDQMELEQNTYRYNSFVRTHRRKLPVVFCMVLFVMCAATMGFLIYEVVSLRGSSYDKEDKEEDISGASSQTIDVDNSDAIKLTDTQKFFHNIGFKQDPLLQDCFENQFKRSFPNIDYMLFGYDIYRGYPLAESHDPGFTYPIFRADYSEKKHSADCRFSIPNGIISVPDVSCVTSFSSETIQTTKQLDRSLAVSVNVRGGGYGASFSASAGYKKATSTISKGDSVFVISTARCNYYFVKLLKTFPPSFNSEFLTWIYKLDTADDSATYIKFMDRFGTHYLTEATFGARFTYRHKMTSSYFEETQKSEYNVAVRASYSGAFSVGGGFSLDQSQRDAASDFSRNVETQTITVGAAPPSNGDALTWASTVKENPIPTKFELVPIEDLFVDDAFSLGIDNKAIRENIIKYKKDYEQHRMNMSDNYTDEALTNLATSRILRISKGGIRGSWGGYEFCPEGEFAIGYNLKVERDQGIGDDTGLNTIRLVCADKSGRLSGAAITSKQGYWGDWVKYSVHCEKEGETVRFLNKFTLEMFDDRHVAASFLTFYCQELQKSVDQVYLELPPGHGPFGDDEPKYTSESCPDGMAICGLNTKVLEIQGSKSDDSALNDVKFYCCKL